MTERGAGLGIAAEPYRVPKNHPRWFGDNLGSVAIIWKAGGNSPPATYVGSGEGFVVARWGALIVVGVYLPPTKSLDFPSFKSRLRDMGRAVRRHLPEPVIIAGDFNAKSETWGSRDGDRRGEEVEDWAAGLDLHLLNEGRESTFVGSRGESIIDLTWASPAALKRVRSWRVADELEALSDHLLIEMELSVTPEGLRSRQPRMQPRPGRWSLNKLDREALDISLEAATWPRQEEGRDLDSEVMAIMEVVAHACDEAMPRVRSCPKRSAWWWTDAIADLRHKSVHLRRAFRRVRNDPHSDPEAVLAARREFCLAAASLRDAIGAARGKGWDTLLLSLDADPWGRPYKMVMNKLKPWTPPLTETLDPRFLERVMGTLFPVREGDPMGPYVAPTPEQQGVVPGVTEEEVAGAIKRVKSRKAPGPDGIPGRVLTLASGYLGGRFARIFSRALRERRFPPVWGRANVVLLRKEGKPEDTPSAYRPICLLDEAGKLFERVIAARLVEHMSRIGPNLDDGQYGFREGRSTVDAIRRLRSLSEAIVQEGGVAVAVSLDIANAFNTLPWAWRDADGKVCERGMSCGVPQGLGLVVAERKTEAIFLHGRRMKPPQAQIRVGRVRVPIEAQMRYLGLTLDGTWCFRQHFNRLVPRLRAVSSRVSRLMPRTGGPDGKARRLHAGVLNSVALYGAPIWAEALAVSRPIQATLRRVQRALAVRVARCYRTVSHVAATVLASMPPLELMALSYMGMYDRKRELLRMGGAEEPLARTIRRMKHQTRQVLLQRWQRLLANARLGLVVAERKTEAIFLHGRRMKPPQAQIRVGRVRVPIEAQMRYLGLTLDGTWCFRQHFNRLVPRLRAVSSRVSRLMPRTGGPDGKARRLHAGVLNSVALYGAPIWAEALAVSRPIQATLRRVQRALAVRVARCYRTVSHVAATVLASMPPLELMALSYMGMYDRKRELLRMGGAEEPLARTIRRMKHQTRQVLLQRWQRLLANARTAPPGVPSAESWSGPWARTSHSRG
ncbi:uncharacterized protein LOC112590638 [Harpegnathos saltator]|uniref:uncharacterized protein LOC112590638 n=1 Tax=Harpegnathos saltator TaxID=610380 RepID=UPI000DBED245|nr:uncharacterized protein LOC112590638 [Harpegnathos saltator]